MWRACNGEQMGCRVLLVLWVAVVFAARGGARGGGGGGGGGGR